MDIAYLIQVLQNKIAILSNAKGQAYTNGDLDRINSVDQELLSTQNTLAQLQLLLSATKAASENNSDLATVVAAGVTSAQSSVNIPDDPTAVLSYYDISTYAADPLYEQKISDILTSMPTMDSAEAIDAYISEEVIGSPLTGAMILSATTAYAVDVRLTMAIMQLDSQFGTAGVGAQTLNPGNVGNTGTSTRTYSSWPDGVAAVAEWLSRHRVTQTLTTDATTESAATSTAATTASTTASSTDTASDDTAATSTTQTTATSSIPFTQTATSTAATTATSTADTDTSASSTPDTTTATTSDASLTDTATTTPADTASTTAAAPTIDASALDATSTNADAASSASSTAATSTQAIRRKLNVTRGIA